MLILILLIIIVIYIIYNTLQTKISNDEFIIKTLIRGCSRWAIASEQDRSPLISLLHANYAAGYLWAIKDIYTSEQIKRWSNVDIIDYQNKITSIQDNATKNVVKICPNFAKDLISNKELAILAGDI